MGIFGQSRSIQDFDMADLTPVHVFVANMDTDTVILHTVTGGKTLRLTSLYVFHAAAADRDLHVKVRNDSDVYQYMLWDSTAYCYMTTTGYERYDKHIFDIPHDIPAGYDIYLETPGSGNFYLRGVIIEGFEF